ncbi:hypothetical protein G9X67_07385 [Rhizobium sp. WYCCWR 11152]|uniref:hypothetical protein n=1 Tax=Rhizobium sp. WYCCWR 11152 TaxID=2692316 RepID=UPI001491D2B7|nr:hypothetical protein [Rhizobium sp. WYCCWR 11152]NNU65105.1 hypothetical protein [Rhizobium sp. WYCCWR 11152]
MAKNSRPSITTLLIGASGWIVSLFLGILDVPAKVNSFMVEAPKTKQEVVDWLNLDQNYTGQWTSSVEDWVDATEDERTLSTAPNGPVRMRLRVYGGMVTGEVESEGLKKGYIFNNLLLEGSRSSKGLDVWAYDYVDGKKRGFAEFRLSLSDEKRLPLNLEIVQGGMGLPVRAKLYRTSTDISEPIYRQPNMELLGRVVEQGKVDAGQDR